MRFVGKLSRLVRHDKIRDEESPHKQLDPDEVRMITDSRAAELADFAETSRLHVTDPRGDTPLHIAARIGNLEKCDLFISAGADARAQNIDRQTPADLALAEGHLIAAKLLTSFVGNWADSSPAVACENKLAATTEIENEALDPLSGVFEIVPREPIEDFRELEELLNFQPEEDPQTFFSNSNTETASGTFAVLVDAPQTKLYDTNVDWIIDLSPGQIVGDGLPLAKTML